MVNVQLRFSFSDELVILNLGTSAISYIGQLLTAGILMADLDTYDLNKHCLRRLLCVCLLWIVFVYGGL